MTLKERREAAGYETATAFAKEIGVKPMLIFRLENGLKLMLHVPMEQRKLIADKLGCHVDDLALGVVRGTSVCKKTIVPVDELEKELKERFGDKLEPINHNKKPMTCYFEKEEFANAVF